MVIAEALRVKTSPRKNTQRLKPEKCSYVHSDGEIAIGEETVAYRVQKK